MCQRVYFSFLVKNGTKAYPFKRVSIILFLISVTEEPRDGLVQARGFTNEGAKAWACAEPYGWWGQSQPSPKAPDSWPEGPHSTRPAPEEEGKLGAPGWTGEASSEDCWWSEYWPHRWGEPQGQQGNTGANFSKNRIAEHIISLQFKYCFQEPQTLAFLNTRWIFQGFFLLFNHPGSLHQHPSHPGHIKDLEIKGDQIMVFQHYLVRITPQTAVR